MVNIGNRRLDWSELLILLLIGVGLLGLFNYWTFRPVTSNSMSPAIEEGDHVLCIRTYSYDVGDVIAFEKPSMYDSTVIHRVVKDFESHYVTKGDNNPVRDDGMVRRRDVICEVVYVLPY